MIDIGVNLTNSRFDKDREQVIARAKASGVNALLITGTNIEESQQALAFCQNGDNFLYSTAGVHPHDADHVSTHYLDDIATLLQQPWVKAVGECGLDFNRNFSAPQQQQKVFSEQVALAAEYKMPLFLHQRDAFEPWLNTLKPFVGKVPAMVSHCFTGSADEVKACFEHGMYIGITGWLCDERRGQALREALQHIPLELMMIETDAPYLTPRTIRPKPKSSRNEPSYLPYIVTMISELTDYTEQQIIQQTELNTRNVFSLGN